MCCVYIQNGDCDDVVNYIVSSPHYNDNIKEGLQFQYIESSTLEYIGIDLQFINLILLDTVTATTTKTTNNINYGEVNEEGSYNYVLFKLNHVIALYLLLAHSATL